MIKFFDIQQFVRNLHFWLNLMNLDKHFVTYGSNLKT